MVITFVLFKRIWYNIPLDAEQTTQTILVAERSRLKNIPACAVIGSEIGVVP